MNLLIPQDELQTSIPEKVVLLSISSGTAECQLLPAMVLLVRVQQGHFGWRL